MTLMQRLAKIFSIRNIFIVILIIIIIYLLTCNGKKVIEPPKVTSVPVQIERIIHDSVVSQKYKDSMQAIIIEKEKNSKYWENAFHVAANEAKSLESSINDYIVQQLPDTCKKYQDWIIKEFNKLTVANAKKDTAHFKIIKDKDDIISLKDGLIENGKEDYKKLRANTDTCFKNQLALEKYIKKVAPKRELLVGLHGMGKYTTPIDPAIGLSLTYRNRKGMEFEGQFFSNKIIVVGIKKTLFKF